MILNVIVIEHNIKWTISLKQASKIPTAVTEDEVDEVVKIIDSVEEGIEVFYIQLATAALAFVRISNMKIKYITILELNHFI